MKTDAQLKSDVEEELSRDQAVRSSAIGVAVRQAVRGASHIGIEVRDAEAWLRGTVQSDHEREAAQGAAWSAPGVRAVINELQVG